MEIIKIKQRIRKFNQENAPFYIVDHDNGEFSLCLPLDLLSEEYGLYCQDALDAYAAEIGESAYSQNGLKTHGSGYEWEAAFRETFKENANIKNILFDCEAGGFFCYTNDLSLLEDFGSRFKDICENTKRFTPIVSAGIKNMVAWEAEQERLMKTVRGQLLRNPTTVFEIMTPNGNIRIMPEDSRALLNGNQKFLSIDGVAYAADELLNQELVGMQRDLFDKSLIRMKTGGNEETMTMSM